MRKIETIEELHHILLDLALLFDKICCKYSIPYYMIEGTQLGAARHKGFIPWDDDMDFGIPRKYYDKFLKVAQNNLPSQYRILTVYNNERIISGFAKLELATTSICEKAFNNSIGVNIDIFPIDYTNTNTSIFSNNRIIKYLIKVQSYRFSPSQHRPLFKRLIAYSLKFILLPLKRHTIIDYITNHLIEHDGDSCTNHYAPYGMKEIMPIDYYGIPTLYEFEGQKLLGIEKPDKYLTNLYGEWQIIPPKNKQKHHILDMYYR